MIRQLAAMVLALWGVQAQADAAQDARMAARALDLAAAELAAASGARDRVAALTGTVRAYEQGLGALRDGLRQVALREGALRVRMDAEEAQVAKLLGGLLSMQSAPEAVLLLHPAGPVDTARAGMILTEVTPLVQARVDVLRADLAELAELRAVQTEAAEALERGMTEIRDARTALSQAISERRAPAPAATDEAILEALVTSSETLAGFAANLMARAELPDSGAGFAAAKGRLPLPVEGRVLRGAGEADAAGIRRPGLVLATQPRALVTAPWPATIRYQGPLLDYGNVMILEPEAGYLLILAGLGEVFARSGAVLPTGAPLGLMGGLDAGDASGEDLAPREAGAQRATETLYMELRQGDAPVDPAAWFAATTR